MFSGYAKIKMIYFIRFKGQWQVIKNYSKFWFCTKKKQQKLDILNQILGENKLTAVSICDVDAGDFH